ncbi:DUF421 domain-containing protein [Mycolicibacterium alvei]|uniref:YetF C-terminal domain-containing protein n=1 Tax=Mycolicibacterium alvei TaxID=67081 RepID=A0A6N4USK0_9MYCO|nr:YetF domain-containing protein [Mycolicibacterium alvei]MCV7001394.1 DUF421 domain-containing protein [Mycolicibacterium alvei]BBX26843.1 hypothetical protein MALV_19680 [Mycolicibacterium alvei]
MINDMFVMEIPILEKILRTVLVYAVIIVLFRLTGKRGLASLNTLDFVVIFLLSNVVQNAIIGADNSLLGGAVGAVTLVAVNTALNRLIAASPVAARVFEGTATTVISDGRVDGRAMRRLGLRRGELEHAVRIQDGDTTDDVELGLLEPSGQLVLTLAPRAQPATRGDLAVLLARLDHIDQQLTIARGLGQG